VQKGTIKASKLRNLHTTLNLNRNVLIKPTLVFVYLNSLTDAMVSCVNSVILNLFSVYLIHTYKMGMVGVKKQWHSAIREEKFFIYAVLCTVC